MAKKEYRAKFEDVKAKIDKCIPRHIWIWNENGGEHFWDKVQDFTTAEEVWAELYEMEKTDDKVFAQISTAEWYVIEATERIRKRKNID